MTEYFLVARGKNENDLYKIENNKMYILWYDTAAEAEFFWIKSFRDPPKDSKTLSFEEAVEILKDDPGGLKALLRDI